MHVESDEESRDIAARPREGHIDAVASSALLASVLCWGAVPVLLRDLTEVIDPWTANGVRYSMAAVLYWPVLIVAAVQGHLSWRLIALCVVPAAFACAGQVLWGLAPYYIDASAIGFLVRFSLVWSLLGAMILFSDERRLLCLPRFYIGLAFSIGGFVSMAMFRGLTGAHVSLETGVVIMLFCSVFFGWYAVSIRYFMREFHPVLSFAVVAQFVSVGTLIAMFWRGEPERILDLNQTEWAWTELVVSSFLGVALGHILLYTGIRRIGASVASGVQSVTPFVTATLGAIFLNEALTGPEWSAGIAMVIGGLILLSAQSVLPRPQGGH